jgi:LacI family repressor for deo operon, udp, cdd, tsx, nupC, and nupG
VSLSLKASPDTPPTSEELRQMVREDGSRGVILIAARASYEWADRLVIEKLPHVVVGSTQHDLDVNQVIMDDQNSATRAVDYLAELGHRDIQIVTFKRDDVVHAARYAGYTQAMSRLMPPDQIPCGLEVETATIATGEIIMHELWALPKHPTAVIVTNETLAVGLVHEARRMGINVPGQLSILAYESQTFLASADPAITAMVSPAFEMGQQAFAMIQRQIQTTPPQDKSARMTVTTSQMHHRLIVRQSTVGPCQM